MRGDARGRGNGVKRGFRAFRACSFSVVFLILMKDHEDIFTFFPFFLRDSNGLNVKAFSNVGKKIVRPRKKNTCAHVSFRPKKRGDNWQALAKLKNGPAGR